MKTTICKRISIVERLLFISSGYSPETFKDILKTAYVPINKVIYDNIIAMDKAYFRYNPEESNFS